MRKEPDQDGELTRLRMAVPSRRWIRVRERDHLRQDTAWTREARPDW